MGNLNKLSNLSAGKKSTWRDDAAWRTANESWLSDSFDIAMKVLALLRAKKMTQKNLAEKMGVTPQFINKIVRGQENLSLETIGKLGKALGVKLIEVAGDEQRVEGYGYQKTFSDRRTYGDEIFVEVYVKEHTVEYRYSA